MNEPRPAASDIDETTTALEVNLSLSGPSQVTGNDEERLGAAGDDDVEMGNEEEHAPPEEGVQTMDEDELPVPHLGGQTEDDTPGEVAQTQATYGSSQEAGTTPSCKSDFPFPCFRMRGPRRECRETFAAQIP